MAFADNILNVRLQLKYDSLENWARENPLLKAGEVAIAYLPPKGNGEAPAATSEAVLMKVGPGNFNNLPFTSALAADVYGWAKENELKFSKAGTGNVVSGIEWDATLNNGKGGIKFTTASVATSEGFEQLQKDVDAVEKDIADNRAAWAKDDNTTYTFAKSTDGKGITITPSEGDGSTISFAFLTQAEIEALNYLVKADITTGSANGTIAVEGADVAVKGLQDAAYTTVSALNATAKGYADAVEAKIPTELGVMSVAKGDDTITIGGTAANPTIAVTANKFDAYGAAVAVLGSSTDGATANTVYGAKAAASAAQGTANEAKTKIDTFLGTITPDGSTEIIDTLAEINKYVGDHGQEFATLSGEVDKIKNGATTVPKATDADTVDGKHADDFDAAGAASAVQTAITTGTAVAKKAEQDADGNVISTTYAKAADLGDLAALDTITSEKVTDFESAAHDAIGTYSLKGAMTAGQGIEWAIDDLYDTKADKSITINGKALTESFALKADDIVYKTVEAGQDETTGETIYEDVTVKEELDNLNRDKLSISTTGADLKLHGDELDISGDGRVEAPTIAKAVQAIAGTTINGKELVNKKFTAGNSFIDSSVQIELTGEDIKMSDSDATTLNAAITARQTEDQVNALIAAVLNSITTINCGSSTEVI